MSTDKTPPNRKYYRRQPTFDGSSTWVQVVDSISTPTMRAPLERIRIVLADDHHIVLQGLEQMLTSAGQIEVVGTAHDAREAHSLLLTHEPDLLLTDLNMPGLNGLEMIAQFRRDFPKLKIVVLSMYRDGRIRKGLKQEGVAAYLLKNTTQRDLIQVISRVAKDQPVAMPEVDHLAQEEFDVDLGVNGNVRDRFVAKFALGKREMEIFQLIALGKSSADIASELSISIETVHSHRKNIKYKTGMKNSAEMAAFAVRNGLI